MSSTTPPAPTHDVLPQRPRGRRHGAAKEAAGAGGDEEDAAAAPVPCTAESAALSVRAPAAVEDEGCEFLEHTADVQLHSWGGTLERAMEWQVLAMFDYMTDRRLVRPAQELLLTVSGAHDLNSLLYKFMDECLFHFSAEFFTLCEVRITHLDLERWGLAATAWGEPFDRTRHTIGTEVKAITFQCMTVLPPGEDTVEPAEQERRRCVVSSSAYNVYVIIDI